MAGTQVETEYTAGGAAGKFSKEFKPYSEKNFDSHEGGGCLFVCLLYVRE